MRMMETNCPLCYSSRNRILFRDHNRRDNITCFGTYVQCLECSLVFLLDCPPWEEIVKFYSSVDEGLTANAGLANAEDLIQRAKRPVPKWKLLLRKIRFRPHSWPQSLCNKGSKNLLDIGCGNGTKLIEFARRGYEVWGVDVGSDAIQLCKALLPEGHFFQGELQKIDLPEGHFDYIRIDNALEHVPNPKEVIRECRRLLCGGGQLMIYVPHGRSLSMRLMKGNSISAWIPFHLQSFTRKSLRRLLNEAGFNPQISQITRINSIRIYEYNPVSWLPLTIMQWRNQGRSTMKCNHPRWLTYACYPMGWLAVKCGMGEELVGIGRL